MGKLAFCFHYGNRHSRGYFEQYLLKWHIAATGENVSIDEKLKIVFHYRNFRLVILRMQRCYVVHQEFGAPDGLWFKFSER